MIVEDMGSKGEIAKLDATWHRPIRKCLKCERVMVNGPFYTRCSNCDWEYFKPCGICGALVINCCC